MENKTGAKKTRDNRDQSSCIYRNIKKRDQVSFVSPSLFLKSLKKRGKEKKTQSIVDRRLRAIPIYLFPRVRLPLAPPEPPEPNKSPVIFKNIFPAELRPVRKSSTLSADVSSPRCGTGRPLGSKRGGSSMVSPDEIEEGEPDRLRELERERERERRCECERRSSRIS